MFDNMNWGGVGCVVCLVVVRSLGFGIRCTENSSYSKSAYLPRYVPTTYLGMIRLGFVLHLARTTDRWNDPIKRNGIFEFDIAKRVLCFPIFARGS